MHEAPPPRMVTINLDNPPQDFLDHMSKAIYDSSVIDAADLVKIDNSLIRKYITCFREAISANDRSCAIIIFAMTEDIIKDIIKSHLAVSDKDTINKLFDINGIVATSHSKLTIAYAFGWISKETFNKAVALKNIRNDFAHQMDINSFKNEKIQRKLSVLDDYPIEVLKNMLASIRTDREHSVIINNIMSKYNERDKIMYLLCSIRAIAFLILELAIWPIANRFRVLPEDVLTELNEDNKIVLNVFAQIEFEILNSFLPPDMRVGVAKDGEETLDLAPDPVG